MFTQVTEGLLSSYLVKGHKTLVSEGRGQQAIEDVLSVCEVSALCLPVVRCGGGGQDW